MFYIFKKYKKIDYTSVYFYIILGIQILAKKSYSKLLKVTQSYSKLLKVTQSYSKLLKTFLKKNGVYGNVV
jgi:hypothetical protein